MVILVQNLPSDDEDNRLVPWQQNGINHRWKFVDRSEGLRIIPIRQESHNELCLRGGLAAIFAHLSPHLESLTQIKTEIQTDSNYLPVNELALINVTIKRHILHISLALKNGLFGVLVAWCKWAKECPHPLVLLLNWQGRWQALEALEQLHLMLKDNEGPIAIHWLWYGIIISIWNWANWQAIFSPRLMELTISGDEVYDLSLIGTISSLKGLRIMVKYGKPDKDVIKVIEGRR